MNVGRSGLGSKTATSKQVHVLDRSQIILAHAHYPGLSYPLLTPIHSAGRFGRFTLPRKAPDVLEKFSFKIRRILPPKHVAKRAED